MSLHTPVNTARTQVHVVLASVSDYVCIFSPGNHIKLCHIQLQADAQADLEYAQKALRTEESKMASTSEAASSLANGHIKSEGEERAALVDCVHCAV